MDGLGSPPARIGLKVLQPVRKWTRPGVGGTDTIELDELAAVEAARAAVGEGDVLIAVSSRTGILWEVMRTPLGAVRRSA